MECLGSWLSIKCVKRVCRQSSLGLLKKGKRSRAEVAGKGVLEQLCKSTKIV